MRSAVPRGLFTALELLRKPSMADVLRQQAPLPEDIGTIIRVAGGCEETTSRLSQQTGKPRRLLVKAARFYLEQVLFYSETDNYRILGLSPDASQQEVREHGRWILRWLHPDNQQSDWDAAFASRVATAWNALKTPARREAYDRTLAGQRARAFRKRPPVHLAQPLISLPERKRKRTFGASRTVRITAASMVFLGALLVPLDRGSPHSADTPLASCSDPLAVAALICGEPATASTASALSND